MVISRKVSNGIDYTGYYTGRGNTVSEALANLLSIAGLSYKNMNFSYYNTGLINLSNFSENGIRNYFKKFKIKARRVDGEEIKRAEIFAHETVRNFDLWEKNDKAFDEGRYSIPTVIGFISRFTKNGKTYVIHGGLSSESHYSRVWWEAEAKIVRVK